MRCLFSVFCVSGLLLAGAAQAQDAASVGRPPQPVAVSPALQAEWDGEWGRGKWYEQPDLLGFGLGHYDMIANNPRDDAVDFRFEFRSGYSLLSGIAPQTFAGWDRHVQLRPMGGVEGTSDGALYGYGGFVLDIFLTPNIFLSPHEVVGLYYNGNGKRLGSVVEFRSTLEAGYRFDNNLRISASFGHISNAGLGKNNPGTEILAGHVYIPTPWVFGD